MKWEGEDKDGVRGREREEDRGGGSGVRGRWGVRITVTDNSALKQQHCSHTFIRWAGSCCFELTPYPSSLPVSISLTSSHEKKKIYIYITHSHTHIMHTWTETVQTVINVSMVTVEMCWNSLYFQYPDPSVLRGELWMRGQSERKDFTCYTADSNYDYYIRDASMSIISFLKPSCTVLEGFEAHVFGMMLKEDN